MEQEFKIQRNTDGEIEECANCGAEVETIAFEFKPYEVWTKKDETYNFCEICSSSFFSRATTRKDRMSNNEQLLFKSIAKGLNLIRQDIRRAASNNQQSL